MARLAVYVDAFNVYYGALRKRPAGHKWLDVAGLVTRCVPGHSVCLVAYFTARVSDQAAAARQDRYLRALEACGVEVIEGQYKTRTKRGVLLDPTPPPGWPSHVTVEAPEEKGSDVNLASRLLIDAYTGRFDQAVVMSLDTDLVTPIRHVNKELNLPVGILYNRDRWNGRLKQTFVPVRLKTAARFTRKYGSADVMACQLPDPVVTATGARIAKPSAW